MSNLTQLPRADLMDFAVEMATTMNRPAFVILKASGETTVTTRELHTNPKYELLATIYPQMAGVKR